MPTLGDRIKKIWAEYIAPSEVQQLPDNKAKHFIPHSNYDQELRRDGFDKLDPEKRREIANHSPLLMKGVRKKSLDTFRAWFMLETLEGRGKPIKADMDLLQSFEKRSNFKLKLAETRIASHIYGDGFLLITFTKDDGTQLSDPVSPESEPYSVSIINSEYITDLKYFNKEYERLGILHYRYKKGMQETFIHPDRIIHVPANQIPGKYLGVSTIDLLRYTIYSKKNVDIAAGYILSWFSRGMTDITVNGAEEDELQDWENVAKLHPTYWAHNEDTEIKYIEPKAIDPKPFYDYIVLNIAAALNMPTHILTGIQIGRVEGSEIGFADYYRDVRDEQELIFTPIIENLYSRILRANGRQWKYKLSWNPIYIDEMAEAKLLEIKVNAAEKALNGSKMGQGFIDTEEARSIFNHGQIELDTQKKIKAQRMQQQVERPQVSPNGESDDDDEMQGPPENPHKPPQHPLSLDEQEMIKRRKAIKKKELDNLERRLFDDESTD